MEWISAQRNYADTLQVSITYTVVMRVWQRINRYSMISKTHNGDWGWYNEISAVSTVVVVNLNPVCLVRSAVSFSIFYNEN